MDKDKYKVVVVAERILINKITNAQVSVKLHQPLQENDDWSCAFSIDGKIEKVVGIDSMQALILALDVIRTQLNEYINELYWLDDLEFLGFPLFVPMYFPDKERKKIELLVDKESNNLLRITEDDR